MRNFNVRTHPDQGLTVLMFLSQTSPAPRCQLLLTLFATLAWAGPPCLPAASPDYASQIKPVLREHCYACHGALKKESGLRLDTVAAMRKGGDSGAAISPESPEMSLLVERIRATDEGERMPPEGKPLAPHQIELIQEWIEHGATGPVGEKPEPDPRDHWAFKAPHRPALPQPRTSAANPIDAFLLDAMQQRGIEPRPQAAKAIQLRRVYLDLTGIPPTRDALLSFLEDTRPDAYERSVDQLLNSPRYGERWGRHWMDVWRYADWYGRRHVPDVWNSAPQVWRWRDWIIQSLNDDRGYDQMVSQMLAADEICPDDPNTVVATGFLVRNWYALNPNDWMRNNVEHVGKAFLGLTFNCAHCHDHKYDPISQADYFRLRAFFEPMYVRQDRVAGEADPGPFQDYEYSSLRKIQRLGAVRVFDKSLDEPTWFYTGGDERNRDQERGPIAAGLPAFLSPDRTAITPVSLPAVAWYPGLAADIQQTARADAERDVKQAEAALTSAKETRPAGAAPADLSRTLRAELAASQARVASLEARIAADISRYSKPPGKDANHLGEEAMRLEREAELLTQEAALLRGKLELTVAESKPQDEKGRDKAVAAARKKVQQLQDTLNKTQQRAPADSYTALSPTYPQTSSGRRSALAAWLTGRDNPLTARVAINHIWMRHFHAPLVETVFDMGRNGAEPSHPKLLDWLAVELMESGWSMKHIHRLIVTSQAYRRVSGGGDADQHLVDPDNRLLWRMNTGRMEAEVVRDSLLGCANQLDLSIGGPPLENKVALTTQRRSVYYEIFPEDGGASPLSELFDPPNPLECYRRTRSVLPQQALALTNSDLVHDVSKTLVRNWEQWQSQRQDAATNSSTEVQAKFIGEMFETILSRSPLNAERRLCLSALTVQQELSELENDAAVTAARESLVRSLLNHNDFVTVR